jgi:hypothetical protein
VFSFREFVQVELLLLFMKRGRLEVLLRRCRNASLPLLATNHVLGPSNIFKDLLSLKCGQPPGQRSLGRFGQIPDDHICRPVMK